MYFSAGLAAMDDAVTLVERAPVVVAGGPVKRPWEVTLVTGTTDTVVDAADVNVVVASDTKGTARVCGTTRAKILALTIAAEEIMITAG